MQVVNFNLLYDCVVWQVKMDGLPDASPFSTQSPKEKKKMKEEEKRK